MTLSIVIPSYNEGTYIGRLLKALTKQTFQDFEIIVSDARSKNGTKEIVSSFKDKLNIKFIQSPPKGPAHGRNEGAKHASGEWLLFLDADVDLGNNAFIKTLLSEVQKKGWKTASTRLKARHATLFDRLGIGIHHTYLRLLTHTKHPVAPGFCILTRRKLFEHAKGFDESLWVAEDYDYVSRTAQYGFGFVNSTYYYVDLRRFHEGGKIRVFLQSVGYEIYRFTHGFKIKQDPFKYKFGHHRERR